MEINLTQSRYSGHSTKGTWECPITNRIKQFVLLIVNLTKWKTFLSWCMEYIYIFKLFYRAVHLSSFTNSRPAGYVTFFIIVSTHPAHLAQKYTVHQFLSPEVPSYTFFIFFICFAYLSFPHSPLFSFHWSGFIHDKIELCQLPWRPQPSPLRGVLLSRVVEQWGCVVNVPQCHTAKANFVQELHVGPLLC